MSFKNCFNALSFSSSIRLKSWFSHANKNIHYVITMKGKSMTIGKINLPLLIDNAINIINTDSLSFLIIFGDAITQLHFFRTKVITIWDIFLLLTKLTALRHEKSLKETWPFETNMPPVINVDISSEYAYYDMWNFLDADNKPSQLAFSIKYYNITT